MPREKIMVHDMTVPEIELRIEEMKKEIFTLRFRNSMRQLDNPLQIRYLRRDMARLRTALAEHKHGIHVLPGEVTSSGSED